MSDVLEVRVRESVGTEDHLVGGDGITRYRSADGSLYSVYPPTAYLGFANWIYMVPPFKPKNMLMLGYAGGTVAGLTQMIYGKDVPITGVDLSIVDNRYGTFLICEDAREFVKREHHFDCVVIDIFNGQITPDFVSSYEFAQRICEITERFLIIHASPEAGIGIYEQFFHRLRLMDFGHKIYYFKKPDDLTEYFPK